MSCKDWFVQILANIHSLNEERDQELCKTRRGKNA